MIGFCDLNYAVKAAFLAVTFLAVSTSTCLLFHVFSRKKRLLEILVLLCLLISGTILILFAIEVKSAHPAWRTTPIVDRVTSLPVILPIAILLLVIATLLTIIIREVQLERKTITRSSVKESLDHLNTGLCFAYKNGMVMLINYRMDSLCRTILGSRLQNANTFWEKLNNGTIQSDVTRLSLSESPTFRLNDGTVWTFSRTVVDGITELTAADTTRLTELTEERKRKNAELFEMNERLRKYGESVDELSREKERLETKARIHRELGKALLMSRGYLQSENGEPAELCNTLDRTIAMLRLETEEQRNDEPLDMLLKAAKAVGIKICITGEMPAQEDVKRLFFEAASEALTNAVRHANAKEFCIAFSEDDDTCSVCFTNDGQKPKRPIVEGGGLGSLRKRAEQIGGTMTWQYQNGFLLKLTLLKK